MTNGSNPLKSFIRIADFKIQAGDVTISLSTFIPVLMSTVCIGIIVLLINSSYGRAFKAIRENEIAAEAMGITEADEFPIKGNTDAKVLIIEVPMEV